MSLLGAVAAFWDFGPPPWPAPPTDEEAWEILRWILGVIVGLCVLDSAVVSPLQRRTAKRAAKELAAQPMVDPYDLESVAVYRLFDEYGFLLYVGIAADVKARFAQHSKDKGWWRDVARWEVEWFRDRATAAAEEARAIVEEAPAYNVSGAPESRKSDPASRERMIADIDGFRRVKAPHLDSLFVQYMRAQSIPDYAPRPFWLRDHITDVYWHAHERAGVLARSEHYRFVRWWEKEHDATAEVAEARRRREAAVRAARRVMAGRAREKAAPSSSPSKRRRERART